MNTKTQIKSPAAKGTRVTIKSIVEQGLAKGYTMKRMLSAVAKTGRKPLPDSIKWYVSRLGHKRKRRTKVA